MTHQPHQDPFYNPETDVRLENGNTRPKDTGAAGKSFGYRQPSGGKNPSANLWELATQGDPERTGLTPRQRTKPVCHNERTRKLLEKYGYAVTKVEQWKRGRGGMQFKCDLYGLWDFEGLKTGEPRLLVQVCGKSGKAEHLRKMTSDKPAPDNRKPRITNLLWCLDQGYRCRLLVWTPNEKRRYVPTIIPITRALVNEVLARKKGPKVKKTA